MRRQQVLSLGSDGTLRDALQQLTEAGAASADIIDNGQVVGRLVSRAALHKGSPLQPGVDAENLVIDLRLAKKIQQQLLPRSVPRIPGLVVYGALHSASAVGGDYWSAKYYPADGRATLKIADVTGHGIAAGILVPAVKYISGGFYRGAIDPRWVITRTNHVLVKETPVEVLVSMVYAWYRTKDRSLEVVNAGHRPAFIVSGGEAVDIPSTGPVLGLIEVEYESVRHQLSPGDVFFTCSDGITEARSGKEFFGEDRVKTIVLQNRQLSPARIAEAVLLACEEFNPIRHDDRSVLVAQACR